MRNSICMMLLLCYFQLAYAALPYVPITFPRDEAAHYKNVPYTFQNLIEWWYLNGKIITDDGKNLSYDVAFFNPAVNQGSILTRPMLHIQVVDLDAKQTFGAAKMYSINEGKISTEKLAIFIENDYSLSQVMQNNKLVYLLNAVGDYKGSKLKVNLILEPTSEPFLINQNGLMPMPNNTNSYYYSIPHFKTTGTIKIQNETYEVSKVPGDSWMDHQWGDFDVQKNGWEWFSIRLDNGLIANIFLNIEYKNNKVVGGLANIRLPSGEYRFIPYNDFSVTRSDYWFDEKESINYPMTFTFNFPQLGLQIRNTAAFPEQEVHGYWEGFCNVAAVYNNQDVKGFSYTELVYATPETKSTS